MPLANFKVLVRPNPGGLEDHKKYVSRQADELLKSHKFADLVITSEDGTTVHCHQSLVVLRSSFLRGICGEAPQHPGSSDVIHLIVPISGEVLATIQELLYTGQVIKTRREIEGVSAGLALLGINDFSGLPVKPKAFIHAGISATPVSKNLGEQNGTNTAIEVVDVQQFLKLKEPPGPKPNVCNPFGFSSYNAGLLVQKLDPTQVKVTIKREEANNNNAINKSKDMDQEGKKRKRIQSSPDDEFSENEEFELEGTPETGDMEDAEAAAPGECEDCGSVLRSEWHRHPSRHDCQAELRGGVRCPDCDTPLRSSWYLPTSRHSCIPASVAASSRLPAPVTASSHNLSLDSTPLLRPRKKRSLSLGGEESHDERQVVKTCEPSLKVEDDGSKAKFFGCPLAGCSRKCETKKLLNLHLAMSHFLVKMEAKYISSADCVSLEDGRRKCPHCHDVQPQNKLGFIRHVAMEHEDVMQTLTREHMDQAPREERATTAAKEELGKELLSEAKTENMKLSKTEEEEKEETTTEGNNEKENAIMECDPMSEEK